jgi:hypothetical protein
VIVVKPEEKLVEVDGIQVSEEVLRAVAQETPEHVWWRAQRMTNGDVGLVRMTLADILASSFPQLTVQ